MKYIEKDGMKLSKIGMGTGRFGTKIELESSFEMLDIFIKYGGNVIDTARNYYEWVENGRGKSEETIGKWIIKNNIREKVYLSTKGGVRNNGKQFYINLSQENLLDEIKRSKDALQTDRIDIYLLHRDEPERPVEDIIETMQIIAENANVKKLGVCNWDIKRIIKANEYAKKHQFKELEIIQTYWSLAEYTKEMWNDSTTTHMDEETYAYIKKHKLMAMAFTSQAKGFFQKAVKYGIDSIDEFLKQRVVTESNLNKLDYISAYCKTQQVSPTAVVNGYITSNEVDAIALVSCTKVEQLIDILENCDYTLEQNVIQKIEKL